MDTFICFCGIFLHLCFINICFCICCFICQVSISVVYTSVCVQNKIFLCFYLFQCKISADFTDHCTVCFYSESSICGSIHFVWIFSCSNFISCDQCDVLCSYCCRFITAVAFKNGTACCYGSIFFGFYCFGQYISTSFKSSIFSGFHCINSNVSICFRSYISRSGKLICVKVSCCCKSKISSGFRFLYIQITGSAVRLLTAGQCEVFFG